MLWLFCKAVSTTISSFTKWYLSTFLLISGVDCTLYSPVFSVDCFLFLEFLVVTSILVASCDFLVLGVWASMMLFAFLIISCKYSSLNFISPRFSKRLTLLFAPISICTSKDLNFIFSKILSAVFSFSLASSRSCALVFSSLTLSFFSAIGWAVEAGIGVLLKSENISSCTLCACVEIVGCITFWAANSCKRIRASSKLPFT